jgi:hypothetical protein
VTAIQTPAPDAPAAEWGALAVRIPGFCPRSGVIGTYRGQQAVFLGFDDRPEDKRWGPWMIAPCSGEWAEDAGRDDCYLALSVRIDEFSIDPDDPATAGCLWVLAVRSGTASWSLTAPEIHWYRLGRACIAYAAALGRWPGGDS